MLKSLEIRKKHLSLHHLTKPIIKTKAMKKVFDKLNNYTRIVITPKDYHLLNFVKGNRPVKQDHVNRMVESVKQNGVTRDVVLVNSIFEKGYDIADGQHLTKALMALGRDIECRVMKCKDEAARVRLMIDLNNTCKSWKANDYIHSWAESGIADYKILRKAMEFSTIQLSVFLMAYTQKRRGIATAMMKKGTFEIADKQYGDTIIRNVMDCHNFVDNTRAINECLVNLMVSVGGYNHKRMLKNLKLSKQFLHFSPNEGEMFKQMVKVYEANA